ncbi:MAG: hotdog fold thioesterase [Candidatus Marinimicrobia bacterium]|nr:hotdog fold thioesterase [Candidatus Neomarinimicrobiota bacterium]MCH7762640.1 hotdog fold thioesterase [Candidatus Neomarinimicrobiota bacterium]
MTENELIQFIQKLEKNTLAENIGIVITKASKEKIEGKMPVDGRTKQPLGTLHGGASVAFAETLGSIAGTINVNYPEEFVVGVEINANHIKSAKSGWVYGVAEPSHIGKRTHVWDIRITNDQDQLVCVSRMTLAVMKSS